MINVFLFVVSIFMLFMKMKADINKLVCILFGHISSISLENFKDHAFATPEILELIKLHTYKFGLVYIEIWLKTAKWFLRKTCFKFPTLIVLGQGQEIYLSFNTDIPS